MNATAQQSPERALVEQESNRARVVFDRTLYPLDAIYGAAYVFIDRCFVYLDAPATDKVEVVLQGRQVLTAEALEALAGEFANELLTHAWRHEIAEANRPILEAVHAQAMAGALGTPGLEDLDDMDFSEETFEDPLGIAMSWEEKYGDSADDAGEGTSEETKTEAEG